MMISREVFSVGIWKPCACFFRRSVRRRKAATECPRALPSSSSALPTVTRPRPSFFSMSALLREGTTALITRVVVMPGRDSPGRGPPPAPPPRLRGDSSSSEVSRPTTLGSSFLAATSAFLRPSSSRWCRRSSSAFRLAAASRSTRSISSCDFRRTRSSSWRLRSSASRTLLLAKARSRASRSSAVSVRSTTPERAAGAGAGRMDCVGWTMVSWPDTRGFC